MKILVADDDPQFLRALKITLGASGYDVVTAADGTEALTQAISQHPDVVMLDLGMPNLNGVEVIEGLRGWSQVPILVVSGRTGAADKVDALDAGADDYVTKPFAMDELLARIRALTRRTIAAPDSPTVTFGDVTVDFAGKTVVRKGGSGELDAAGAGSGDRPAACAGSGELHAAGAGSGELHAAGAGSGDRPAAGAGSGDSATATTSTTVRLTPTEWRILELLLQSPGRLITRETMLTQVWGPHHSRDTGYLRLYLAQLRKKLEPVPAEPRYLVTVQGMGYRFVPDEG